MRPMWAAQQDPVSKFKRRIGDEDVADVCGACLTSVGLGFDANTTKSSNDKGSVFHKL